MSARPFPPVPSAAMAGISRSSCGADTYAWLVRLNTPVWSNYPLPTTQYAAAWCTSGLPDVKVWLTSVGVEAHSWPWAWETWVMKSPLVSIPPSGQDLTDGLVVRPAFPHSSPSGIGPAFCAATVLNGSLYDSTPENS